VLLVRDLLDQTLRDPDGLAAGRVDDFVIVPDGDDAFVDSILSGGGVLADDLGVIGRGCEVAARVVRRRPLRRAAIPWSLVREVAEHAVTVEAGTRGKVHAARERSGSELRLRVLRRLPMRCADGVRLRVVDVLVSDPAAPERLRVVGLIVRRRNHVAWPASLRPRQRAAPREWRFVSTADVRFAREALAVDHVYDDLPAARGATVSRPPARIPRAVP
jgi:hypothetical protein